MDEGIRNQDSRIVNRDGKTVTIEFPCSRCKYNLYGRSIDQDCPECGQPIRTSLPLGEQIHFFSMNGKWSWAMIGYELGAHGLAFLCSALIGLAVAWRVTDFRLFVWVVIIVCCNFTSIYVIAVPAAFKKWKVFRIVVGPDEIHYTRSAKETGMITRSMVKRIIEWPGIGFGIRAMTGFRSCEVPREMDGYAEFRRMMEGWRTFETASFTSYIGRIQI